MKVLRPALFAGCVVAACQPIVIGNPGVKDEDDAAAAAGGMVIAAGGEGGDEGSLVGGQAGGLGQAPEAGAAGTGGRGIGGNEPAGDGGEGGERLIEVDPHPLRVKVLVGIYDPIMTSDAEPVTRLSTSLGVDTPEMLVEQLKIRLEQLTEGHVRLELDKKPALAFPPLLDGLRYTPESYAACLADEQACHPALADYAAIDSELDLCTAVETAEPQQIWLLGGARFGFGQGSQLSCPVSEDDPPVSKRLDVVYLDYSAGLASMLKSLQLHGQTALLEVFGLPAPNATAETPDNAYGVFVQAAGRQQDIALSGCGDATFAPNSLEPNRFDDPRSAPSYCESFLRAPRPSPLDSVTSLDCSAWGCSELGFREYWLAHVPRGPWSDQRDRLNDFWRYILNAAERRQPVPEVSVSCSSSYLPGWCEKVTDGKRKTCNESEWATAGEPTGFVEFRFVPPKLISGIDLYDRACVEQVTSGHIEFSDGSPSLAFGLLENSGDTPRHVPFSPKLLSGFRVVIDEARLIDPAYPLPGFSEISYASSQ